MQLVDRDVTSDEMLNKIHATQENEMDGWVGERWNMRI